MRHHSDRGPILTGQRRWRPHESGSGRSRAVVVNPVDPPIGMPWRGHGRPPATPPSRTEEAGLAVHGSPLDDARDGAVAVLAVTAALLRYTVERTVQARRTLLPRVPLTGRHRCCGGAARAGCACCGPRQGVRGCRRADGWCPDLPGGARAH